MNFYFVPTHNKHSININAYSYYGKIELSFAIYKNKDKEPSVFWPFPDNKEDADEDDDDGFFEFEAFTSEANNKHSYTIKSEALESCWP